jgi:hypothetical protein
MTTLLAPFHLSLADLKPVLREEIPLTFSKNRTCTLPGCITRLSVYNPGPDCFCHTRRYDPNEDRDAG